MQRIFQILFSLLVISGLTFSQVASRDLSQTPSNFNNPEYVYGPELENPTLGFSESFEGTTFPPAGWIKANPDGGTGWNRQTVGTTPIPGWTGGVITAPPGGGNAVAFCTWNTGGPTANDQWLITPQVMNVQAGDVLSFWMLIFANDAYLEQVDIRISTTGTNVSDFTTIVQAFVWPVGTADTGWVNYTYNLTNHVAAGSNIYIAFREHVADNFNDGAAVLLDLVEVTQGGGGTSFFEDFEGFIVGQQLACQDPVNWTTWSQLPCSPEDPVISSNYAHSGTKSFVIVQVNDLVKPVGNQTTGEWYMSWWMYIPTGKYGYFNVLNTFPATTSGHWGMEVYFGYAGPSGPPTPGMAHLLAFNPAQTDFPFSHDTWFMVTVYVNLDTDIAQLWLGSTMIHQWQWTRGNPGTYALRLAAPSFFGPSQTANDECYYDDFWFADFPIPVELTSFIANVNNLGQVVLNWETASELNNQGFEIERRTESSEFRTVGFVEGHGTTTQPRSYSYVDKTAEQGVTYYRLKQIDFNGTYAYSDVIEVDVTGPLTFDLAQNYPNPFNPSTNIKYSVPESGNIRLSVFNIVGEEVAVLVNGFSQAGFFEVTFDASNLSTGVYLYKLQSANSVQMKKMVLLK